MQPIRSIITPRIILRIMSIDSISFRSLMHLLQLSDSALPVGGFSFSNTLESAVAQGLVVDDVGLESYVAEAVRAMALSDGVAALYARRRMAEGYRADVVEADNRLICSRLSDEARQMSQRMGRKLAELAVEMIDDEAVRWWRDSIESGITAGTYAATLGVVAALCHIGGREMFCSLCYGTASMMLGAALRTMRTTHLSTQKILFRLADKIGDLYLEAEAIEPSQMNSFTPQLDIMASLHEKGDRRMFMN